MWDNPSEEIVWSVSTLLHQAHPIRCGSILLSFFTLREDSADNGPFGVDIGGYVLENILGGGDGARPDHKVTEFKLDVRCER